jgi:sortase A
MPAPMLTTLQKSLGRALIIAGALVLGFWGQLKFKQVSVQRSALHVLERKTSRVDGTDRQNVALALTREVKEQTTEAVVGQLEIPRIHVSVVVLEGSNPRVLDVAAGHIEGTALPGRAGNVAIAAHRDTFFRALGEIRANDIINLQTVNGNYQYKVESTEIVGPRDVEVLRRTTQPELTLVTCYPFYYIGPAPKRFIVHARQSS